VPSCNEGTHVAGIRTWNELGRYVKKGQKGIPILAPMIGTKRQPTEEPSEQTDKPKAMLIGFRVVYVFERLSRDLWPGFYPLDREREPMLRTYPRSQQLHHRLIPSASAMPRLQGLQVPTVSTNLEFSALSRKQILEAGPL